MFHHLGEHFGQNISRCLSRVFLAQFSCSIYQVINPILSVRIFDTGLSLLILHSLGTTLIGQPDLVVNI